MAVSRSLPLVKNKFSANGLSPLLVNSFDNTDVHNDAHALISKLSL